MRSSLLIEQAKGSLGIAWDEFTRSILEAHCLTERRAEWNAIAELVHHARELLDIIEWETSKSHSMTASGAREVLAPLAGRLQLLGRILRLSMDLFENLVQEFNAALDRAILANRVKGSKAAVDEVHYADNLCETIAEEIRLQELREPIEGVPPLAQLYSRLKTIESTAMCAERG